MLQFAQHVILPLVVGAVIYFLFRSDAPIFVEIIHRLQSELLVKDFDHKITWALSPFWDWLVYNLPDGLWAYSLTSFLIISTHTDSQLTKLLYLLSGLVMMIVTEIVYGVFDWFDVIAMLCGFFASLWILKTRFRK